MSDLSVKGYKLKVEGFLFLFFNLQSLTDLLGRGDLVCIDYMLLSSYLCFLPYVVVQKS